MKTLADLFEEDEAKQLAEFRAEQAREFARIEALSPEQRAAEIAAQQKAYEEKWGHFDDAVEEEAEEDEEDDEEEG